jgi:HTH-type transcriptional regulator/antitoxin HipB
MENAFGQRLQQLRKAAGLTQAQLAEQIGLSQNGLSQWEAGLREPGISQVAKLCEVLGVKCDAFMEAPAADVAPVPRSRPSVQTAESTGGSKPTASKPQRGKKWK